MELIVTLAASFVEQIAAATLAELAAPNFAASFVELVASAAFAEQIAPNLIALIASADLVEPTLAASFVTPAASTLVALFAEPLEVAAYSFDSEAVLENHLTSKKRSHSLNQK